MKPRVAVVVSDLHAGSTYGLMPRGFHTKEGNEIGLNSTQSWLIDRWEDCWKWANEVIGKDEWVFILNGDLIDGYHHGTKEVWSNDESDHGIAAYHLLKDHARKAHSVYLTEGTEVHTKGHEHALAYQLKSAGSNVIMPKGMGGAWASLDLEIAGTHCSFDHHIGTSKRRYLTGTKMTAEYGDMIQRKAVAGHSIPKVVGRAHCHEFTAVEDSYGLIFTTPPWQDLTRFARKVVPNAILTVGMVILDWREVEDNAPPVLRKRLYTPKKASIVKT